MMEITKSINAERGWDGYRLPLHSESVLLFVNFFFWVSFHFVLSYLFPLNIPSPEYSTSPVARAARINSINSVLY